MRAYMNATNVASCRKRRDGSLSNNFMPAGIACERQVWGVYSGEVTPDPIPNSEVKLAHGKTSTEEARRKASSMPHFNLIKPFTSSLQVRGFVLSG